MPPATVSDAAKRTTPESLISVLNELPRMVDDKVEQIHNLLNALEENLT